MFLRYTRRMLSFYHCLFFKAFLVAYFVDLVIMVAERVYMDPALKHFSMMLPVYKARAHTTVLTVIGKTELANRWNQYARDLVRCLVTLALSFSLFPLSFYLFPLPRYAGNLLR